MSHPDDLDSDGPLTGIRVIDFTMAFAGPLSTMLLADMGADVIKIEDVSRPESLEMMRISLNRNKRSVSVNLKTPAGLQVARDLIATAQVVVSSFRPGVMAGFGLGADDLLGERPDLIYASLSGYGETGPQAHRRSMDKIVQAESGLMSIGSMIDQVALVDCTAGTTLASAIVAALFRRERTGRGGRVSGRLLDAGLLLQMPSIASFSVSGSTDGTAVAGYPVADLFDTADGAVFIAAYYDWHWRALCEVLGLQDLAEDPRFVTREQRTLPENASVLRPLLREIVGSWRRDQLVAALDKAGVMVTAIRRYPEIFADPQVLLNETFIDAPYRDGTVKLVRPPFTFDDRPTRFVRPTPEIGDDTIAVLGEIGYEQERIAGLLGEHVVYDSGGHGIPG
ncbi:MAG TPA: CaiB/BaiF CoA-transferase family protein [Streptosporangiaceae bacterium]|nr:CaiB/BaiF CoA-transferase family protein [Streptosporangiaceae bacterium]